MNKTRRILDICTNKYNQQTRWFLCGSVSGKVSSTGSNHLSGLKRDNSTIGVGNKSSKSMTIQSNGFDNSTSNSENVEVINSTRLLGTILTDDLKWDLNVSTIVKKANARMEL